MLIPDHYFYTLRDPRFYDTLEQHRPNKNTFYEPVSRILPGDWLIRRFGIWFVCEPKEHVLPAQGWKIHVSATLLNAGPIVTTVARLLCTLGVSFKFAADENMLSLLLNKRWPRGGSGKFIAIYPRNIKEFTMVIEKLREALCGYNGPYILSDRRYKDCRTLFYRYGGFSLIEQLSVTGEKRPVLQAPNGEFVLDHRDAYFDVPSWVPDPFPQVPDDEGSAGTLKNGRYIIDGALSFSNWGGVYAATDTATGSPVVIKEARPFTGNLTRGLDAVSSLKKEHRLLGILADLDVAPKPIDFFCDWEHYFLVEEFLEGDVLRNYAAQHDLALRVNPSPQDVAEFYSYFVELYSLIAEGLEKIHSRNIVFSDMSHYNIIVLRDGKGIRFIDFEGAHEKGIDEPTLIYTPGFETQRMKVAGKAEKEDDYYGLGGIFLASLMPINNAAALDQRFVHRYLRTITDDLALPDGFRTAVEGLMHSDVEKRITPAHAVEILRASGVSREPDIKFSDAKQEVQEGFVRDILKFVISTATYDRRDRLFPSGPELFQSNPLSIAYGAYGVAYVLKKILGNVPAEVMRWLQDRELNAKGFPPGLYVGTAGIAWALLELGVKDKALDLIRETHADVRVHQEPDIFFGSAGWGMAQLRFFLETQNELFLEKAKDSGKHLLNSKKSGQYGYFWPCMDDVWFGLAHGGSGIALFLIYLYCATGDERYADASCKALDEVLARGVPNPDGNLSFLANQTLSTFTPYWRYGSAGVGMVLLRVHAALGEERFRSSLFDLLPDAQRKYTIFPGFFFGLAGVGEFLLDMADFCKDGEQYVEDAWKIASGLLLFGLKDQNGTAFPGEQLSRISCDYGTGGAGIALFLSRLLRRGRPSFMLDELLGSKLSACPPSNCLIRV